MCGIVGYLGSDNCYEYIMSGLKFLQNRGYDSTGVSTIYNSELQTIKCASTNINDSIKDVDKLLFDLSNKINISGSAIGHTRWATHGSKNNINAHPHHDSKNRIAVVHNGIIENFQELKDELISKKYTFRSHTDTEAISILIGMFLDEEEHPTNAIKKAVEKLSGTWALAIIHKDYPNSLWITRNGSPLLLGIEDDFVMIASEQIAFGKYIKKYIVLDNHDIIEITHDGNKIKYDTDIHRYNIKEKIYNNLENEHIPNGFSHWMLKEIMEQPNSIIRSINNGGRIESDSTVRLGGLDICKSRLLEINHIILLGCGTSLHSGMWSLEIFKDICDFYTVTAIDGAEFSVKDIPKNGVTGLILLSQSGETSDLYRCIKIAKEKNLVTIGVVNVPDSLIARETDCGTYLNSGREVAVASTKSFTNQCVVLSMIAIWFSQNKNICISKRKRIIKDIQNLSYDVNEILKNCKNVKSKVSDCINNESMFILGKGQNYAIAKEGSLKIKEVTYIHAEGYSSSALKHGPFAMIKKDLPVIIIDTDDEHRDKNKSAYQEIYARDAKIIKITDIYNNKDLIIKKNKTFHGVLANVYLQLLSYYISISMNYNPDFPRNLAKVVTVE